MYEEVKEIFKEDVVVNGEVIPVSHLTYKGKSKKFITWTILEDKVGLSANDEPLYGVCAIDIDIFSDSNYLGILKEIKKRMINSGWIWTGDSPEMYEEDTGLYHRTTSFEKERTILWQE